MIQSSQFNSGKLRGLKKPVRETAPHGLDSIRSIVGGAPAHLEPGGWLLIGTTDADLWDVDRAEPALLPPGTRVRFEAQQ